MGSEITANIVANKPLTIRGKRYKAGEPVDVKNLPAAKVSQLLDLRLLRPHIKTG